MTPKQAKDSAMLANARRFAWLLSWLRYTDSLPELHLSDAALAYMLADALDTIQPDDDHAHADAETLAALFRDMAESGELATDNGLNPSDTYED